MIFLEGLYLASSSASSAIFDLVPAITFVVASIVGKGPKLLNSQLPPSNSVLLNTSDPSDDLLASRLFMSLWQQLLLVLLANYPDFLDHLSLSAWICFTATIPSVVVVYGACWRCCVAHLDCGCDIFKIGVGKLPLRSFDFVCLFRAFDRQQAVMNDLRRQVEAKRRNEKQRRFRSRGYVHGAEVAVDASKPVHGRLRFYVGFFNANLEDVTSIREEDIFPSIQRLSKMWIAARFSKGIAAWDKWISSPYDILALG
ncbi:WAT1-related protein [Tanacetum coccineum]